MMTTIYDHDRKSFLIKEDDRELADVFFGFSDLNQEGTLLTIDETAEYQYAIMYKYDVKEVDYRQTFVNTGRDGGNPKRVGWMIPLATLITTDEDILAAKHLNQYVFFAYCYLLENAIVLSQILEKGKELKDFLVELFPDACLLILNKNNMPEGISLKRLELSLARNGYFMNPTGYKNPFVEKGDKLTLTPASEILRGNDVYEIDYIEEFLTKYTYNSNSFIRFMYLYQIIEVLMDKEIIQILEECLDTLKNNKPSFRKYDSILKDRAELKRLKQIISNASLKSNVSSLLDTKCKVFLHTAPGQSVEQPATIYHVRNHIVHRFRKAAEEERTVNEICDYLELYLYDLLICYKLPQKDSDLDS